MSQFQNGHRERGRLSYPTRVHHNTATETIQYPRGLITPTTGGSYYIPIGNDFDILVLHALRKPQTTR